MKACIYVKTPDRLTNGYFDCPWKTLIPDIIYTDVYYSPHEIHPLRTQFGEVIRWEEDQNIVIVNEKNEVLAMNDNSNTLQRAYVDTISIHNIWNQWP